MQYRTLLIDPPWPQPLSGKYKRRKHGRPARLPYDTMPVDGIIALPVEPLLAEAAHVYLWTTNWFLHDAFHCFEQWGISPLSTITWVKPSGFGNYWVSRTEFLLMGYYGKCKFERARYRPNVIHASRSQRHSRKPPRFYHALEAVSRPPRLELFARPPHRPGWHVWGDEATPTTGDDTAIYDAILTRSAQLKAGADFGTVATDPEACSPYQHAPRNTEHGAPPCQSN